MSIVSDFKEIGKFLQQMGNVDLYNKLIENQEKIIEILDKNHDLKEENRRLKEDLEIKNSLIHEKNIYWLEKDNEKIGPFCTKCYDDERKLIHVIPCPNPKYIKCPKCGLTIKAEEGSVYIKKGKVHK